MAVEATDADHGRGLAAQVADLPRLWLLYSRLDLFWVGRNWKTALGWYVADIVVGLGAVGGVFLLAERFDGIGTWSTDALVFMLGYALLSRGALDLVFGWNVATISRRIGRGQLDHMLIQPRPLWLIALTEGFSPITGSGTVLIGAGLMIHAGSQLALEPGALWGLALLLNLAASVAIALAFNYAIGSVAFFAPRSAEEINSRTTDLLRELRGFPLDGLSSGLQTTLLTAVPAGFVAWLPARALLDHATLPILLYATPAAALGFGTIALLVFKLGLTHYGHTGSRRYLDLGHRR